MSKELVDRLEQLAVHLKGTVYLHPEHVTALDEAISVLRSEPVAWSAHGIKREDTCIWMQDSDGLWNTSCGKVFEFTNEGPAENEANFCYHCGGALLPEPYSDAAPSRETAKRSATSTQEGLGRLWNAQTAKPEAEPALSAEQFSERDIEYWRRQLLSIEWSSPKTDHLHINTICDMALRSLTAPTNTPNGDRQELIDKCLDAGRDEGIEAAAKVCNPDANGWNNTSDRHIAYSIRDKILALKGQP